MNRLFDYFKSYSNISPELIAFLTTYGKIKEYNKDYYYLLAKEKKEKFLFILEGLVAIITYQDKKENIERVYCDKFYFTGTKHVFSNSCENFSIKFLRRTHVYEISNQNFITAINHFPELKDIYLIIKEHEIQHNRNTISILNSPPLHRLLQLSIKQPILNNILTVNEKVSYLNFTSLRQYYTALNYYLKYHS
ncbi:Crp/Fnr family transcriptional regulator [Sphingobacterium litopenaei]|uniref:Crp/Fnr family transcriptional regulator n=1 Tax=Sphingobacterium litopenaei TaxID=2763500 RepID=A0ABR7YEQ9_9SPHI|nr:Crp/Fnr family transcriptional regulator [Sphingobacterium litopenaei]MBD1429788.1 Crp/Fnr family transcriptional regulator [Sphingobacterium litopenaei]